MSLALLQNKIYSGNLPIFHFKTAPAQKPDLCAHLCQQNSLVPSTLFSVDFMMEAKRNKPM
jgi:hypothetical protein